MLVQSYEQRKYLFIAFINWFPVYKILNIHLCGAYNEFNKNLEIRCPGTPQNPNKAILCPCYLDYIENAHTVCCRLNVPERLASSWWHCFVKWCTREKWVWEQALKPSSSVQFPVILLPECRYNVTSQIAPPPRSVRLSKPFSLKMVFSDYFMNVIPPGSKMLFSDYFINGTEQKPRYIEWSFGGNMCWVTVVPVYTTPTHYHGIEWIHLTLSSMHGMTYGTRHTKALRSAQASMKPALISITCCWNKTGSLHSPLLLRAFSFFEHWNGTSRTRLTTHTLSSLLTSPVITASEAVSRASMQASERPSGLEEGMLQILWIASAGLEPHSREWR